MAAKGEAANGEAVPVYTCCDWWQCLSEIIRPILSSPTQFRTTVPFLQQFIDCTVTETLLSQAMRTKRPVVVASRRSGVCLTVERWAGFARSLGLDVEVPGDGKDWSKVKVNTTPAVQDTCLQYVARSLEGLMDLESSVVLELLGIKKDDLHRIWLLMMKLSTPEDVEQFSTWEGSLELSGLWESYGGILEYVGFQLISGPSPRIVYSGTEAALCNYRTLRNFLHGVLENPGEESFV